MTLAVLYSVALEPATTASAGLHDNGGAAVTRLASLATLPQSVWTGDMVAG